MSSSSSRHPSTSDDRDRYPNSSSRDYRSSVSNRDHPYSSSSSSYHHSSSSTSINSSSSRYGHSISSSSNPNSNRGNTYNSSNNSKDINHRDDRICQRSRSRSRERYRSRSRERSSNHFYDNLPPPPSSFSRNEYVSQTDNDKKKDSNTIHGQSNRPSTTLPNAAVPSVASSSTISSDTKTTIGGSNNSTDPKNTLNQDRIIDNNGGNDNNDNDDEEYIYEDEDAKAARLLEESKKRRQMITAKYKEAEKSGSTAVSTSTVNLPLSSSSSSSSSVGMADTAAVHLSPLSNHNTGTLPTTTVSLPVIPSQSSKSLSISTVSPSSTISIPSTSNVGISITFGKKSRFSSTTAPPNTMDDEDKEEEEKMEKKQPLISTSSPKQTISMLEAQKVDILPHLLPNNTVGSVRPLSIFDEDNDSDWENETFLNQKYRSSLTAKNISTTTTKPINRKGNYANPNDTNDNIHDGNDDIEGYYKLRVDEVLCGRYRVLGTRGRGVFSSVLFCQDLQAHTPSLTASASTLAINPITHSSIVDDEQTITDIVTANGEVKTSSAPITVNSDGKFVKHHSELATGSFTNVAIKVIRNNDVMHKAALKEIEILKNLTTADPTGKYHCVRLLHTFEHNQHTCLVFEPLAMNLKEVQVKYGSGVGLSINAVRNYTKQLLLALGLLSKLHIIHGDIKPHNILANEGFQTIKLADFGSAFSEYDSLNEPAPYLVSRFYRAPEIILGYKHTAGLDMWSVACVLYELHSGKPLFPGISNNDMLAKIQALRGKFPNRMIKRHLHQVQEIGIESHFDDEYRFRCTVFDPVTKQPGSKYLTITNPTEDLAGKVLAHKGTEADRRMMNNLIDLLSKMLLLDPAQRINVKDALQHPFVRGHPK